MTVSEIQTLRRAADMFHDIVSTLSARRMLAEDRPMTGPIRQMLQEHAGRDPETIAADAFEMCVLALAAAGDTDVTIHVCGEAALGELP